MYGNKGRRKFRSPWFSSEFERNAHAQADKDNGFRVRKYSRQLRKGKLI
jgi:hypothetical protein